MTKPLALAFGGCAVLVAAIALVVQMRDKPGPTPVAAAPVTARPDAAPGARPGSAAVVVEGSHPRAGTEPEGQADPVVTEIDGKIIRDHRKNATPIDLPPTARRPGGHQIASAVTHDITQKVVKVLNQCATAVPATARGPKPRADGQIVISIKDKQVVITRATVKLRDVEGEVVEPTQRCIEEKSVGLTTTASDERDVENYEISISFALI